MINVIVGILGIIILTVMMVGVIVWAVKDEIQRKKYWERVRKAEIEAMEGAKKK